ncbi:unnamed protein product [Natator depressus]
MPPNNLPETVTDEKRQLHPLPSPAQCLYRTEHKKETSLESTRFICPSSFCVTHLAGYRTRTRTHTHTHTHTPLQQQHPRRQLYRNCSPPARRRDPGSEEPDAPGGIFIAAYGTGVLSL